MHLNFINTVLIQSSVHSSCWFRLGIAA